MQPTPHRPPRLRGWPCRWLFGWICGCCLVCIGGWSSTASAEEQAPPRFLTLRHEEDYRSLQGKKNLDAWERWKYIPGNERGDLFLSIGGEARWTFERFGNPEWGEEAEDDNGYSLLRTMLHADLRAPGGLRFFLGLMSNHELGRLGGPRPPDENRLGVHQAFLELTRGDLRLRLGRQELQYGSGRLISIREGPNSRNSFDGFRLDFGRGSWRTDVFASRPVETDEGTLDDGTIDSRALWGIYWTKELGRQRGLDLYYLGWENEEASFDQGPGEELRHSLGIRFFRPPGDGWDYNFEAVLQQGRYRGPGEEGSILAWTLASDTGFTFGNGSLGKGTGGLGSMRPRIGLKVNITSGDRDPLDPDLGTFNPLVPRGNYFGDIGLLGPYNLVDVHPSLHLTLHEKVRLRLDAVVFWRQSDEDGVYGNPGNLVRSGRRSTARFIGFQPGVELSWDLSRFWSLSGILSYFDAGRFLEETGPAENVSYVELKAGVRF